MQVMDCEHCAYGEQMKPGAYKQANGSVMIMHGETWKCKRKVISGMQMIGDEIYCGGYERNDSIEQNNPFGRRNLR